MSEHRQMGLPLTFRHEWVDRLPAIVVLQGILPLSVELANHARPVLEPPEIVDAKRLARIERITKLHLQLWRRKTVCNKECPKTRLTAVFRQPVRIRRDHLRSAIPSPALAIGAETLAQVIARYALCSQRRIGNRQAIRKRRAQQAILYRAPKRRRPHAVDLFKRARRPWTQQPASCTQRHRATCLNKKSRPEQIIRHLQTPQKRRVITPKRPIGMKLRKPFDGTQRSPRRRQRIPIMLKTEQIRLGFRNIISSHMTPQPHELGIVVCHEQCALFSRLREPGKHPIPRQGVTRCMLLFENGIRHFHHHHIGQMGHRRCCLRWQMSQSVTGRPIFGR